jgi:DNA-binding transcriptional MocR family regulator
MPSSHSPVHRVGVRELAPLLDGWRPADDEACRHAGNGSPGLGERSAGNAMTPGYAALAERLRTLILDGRLPLSTLLPSERTLAETIGTSRTTTTAAYGVLRDTGFAESRQGRGTWTTLPGSARAGTQHDAPWPVQPGDGIPGPLPDLAMASFEAPPQLHAAYAAALADLPRYLPGHGYATAGLPGLRAAIARRFTDRGLPTRAEQILVTSGSTQALRLVLEALLRRGDRAVVEHPTWPMGIDAVRTAGGRPVALPMEGGWDADRLAWLVRRANPRLAYLVPDFHNPTGRLLDLDGRRAIAGVLGGAGCTIVVDETTAELDLRGELQAELAAEGDPRAGRPVLPVPPMATCAGPAEVITLGSASKTFWGGLRIGWVRADEPLIRRLTQLRAAHDLAGPVLEQLTAVHLLAGIDDWLPQRRAEVARRCSALRAGLARRLPGWTSRIPDGGLALWVTLPRPESDRLTAAARALGLGLTPGARFAVEGGLAGRIRLPFTRPVDELAVAVDVLAAAWSGGPGRTDDDDPLAPVV